MASKTLPPVIMNGGWIDLCAVHAAISGQAVQIQSKAVGGINVVFGGASAPISPAAGVSLRDPDERLPGTSDHIWVRGNKGSPVIIFVPDYTGSATAPGQPTGLAATPGQNQVALAWAAPGSNGGSAISDYLVEYKLAADPNWIVFEDGEVSSTGSVITGLPALSHNFRVSAVNAVGAGTPSATVTSTPIAAPSAPAKIGTVTPTPGSGKVDLSWSAPANGGSAITDYLVQYKLSTAQVWRTFARPRSTATSASVNELANTFSYDFRVAAVNGVDRAEWSDPVSATFTPVGPTLGTLTLNGTLTQGVAASGVTITGATAGSSITLSIAGLTISGTGATRTVSGAPASSGSLSATETLAGATGSPKTTSVGSVTASGGNPLPALTASYVYDRWSAQHFAPQADNTDLSSYTSPTTGITLSQATAANRPKYRAAISPNGKPGIQCTPTQWLDAGNQPAGLVAALQRPNAVVMIIYRNLVVNAGGAYSSPVGTPPSGGSNKLFSPYTGGTENGQACVGRIPAARINQDLSELQVFIYCADNTSTKRDGVSAMRRPRIYLNGTRIGSGETWSSTATQPAPGSGNFRWGGMGNGFSPASIVMHDYFVLDMPRNFDQCDALDWTKWAHAEYGDTVPWASEPFFWVFEGDSTTAGVGSQAPGYSMPIYCAFGDGRKNGTWTNLGVSGCDMDYINYKAPHDIDRITAITGKPCLIHLNEYTNRAGIALAQLIAEDKTYFAHARAVLPTAKILQTTPIALQSDTTNGSTLALHGTRRIEYKDAILAYPLHGVDGPDMVVDIFPNPNIGAINSNPFGATYPSAGNGWVGSTEYWNDNLHPFVAPTVRTPNGYSEYASIVLPGMQALETA